MNAQAPITRLGPGCYDDIPNEVYHGDCCVGPSISSTGIRVCAVDPARYWLTSPMNPAAEKDDAPSKLRRFVKGTAAHLFLLEPELIDNGVSVIPEEMLGANGAVSTKAAKEFVQEQSEAGRAVLKPEEWDRICAMAHALGSNERVMKLLTGGSVEQSHIWRDAETGVFIKSRPDFTPHDPAAWIVDYKTTDRDDIEAWERASTCDHRLDMQAALQMWGANETRGHTPPGVVYIVQHVKTAQIAIRWFDREHHADLLAAARLDLRRGVNAFAECWRGGQWTGPWDKEVPIEAPDFRARAIERQLEKESAVFPGMYAA